jgi:pimeloyl-ACP methyl ester carboxylesterase
VVFVHGTASSPAYWAETVNSLWADDDLRDRTQIWVYTYATGNPILYSAAKLREALVGAVAALDPDGADPALRRMVLVGHSQGGLLVRLMVVDGNVSWWEEIYGTPLDEWNFAPEDEALIRGALDFDPLDEVDRVVFISTPHRGSFIAGKGIAHLIARMVELPGEVSRVVERTRGQTERIPPELAGSTGTSVANMDPANPFSRRLTETRFAPGVHVHSIVSVSGSGDPTLGDDGVVEYSSAHIDEAESELIVPSAHSCQGHPFTILELRRILRLATGLSASKALP